MKLTLFFLLCSICMAQELLRPTVDVDGGNVTAIGCSGQSQPSPTLPLAYDAAGPTTQSTLTVAGNTRQDVFKTRVFKTWAMTGNKYVSLTLNVTSSSIGYQSSSGFGQAAISYSINNGITWTSIISDGSGLGWQKKTSTITISALQDLTQLRVGVCASGSMATGTGENQSRGVDNVALYDITTLGFTTAQSGGNGSSSGQSHRGVVIVN